MSPTPQRRTGGYASTVRRLAPLLVALAALAGCGGGHYAAHLTQVSPAPAPPLACNPPVGHARMGECVEKRFRFVRPQAFTGGGARGIDISVFQGFPCWSCAKRAGLRFVWNQSSDAFFRQSNFVTNWVRERQLGIPHGAYIFLRPGCGSCQGRFLADRIRAAGGQDANALLPLLDAEVPGAYANVCSAAAAVRQVLHISLVATYASPGLWDGSPTCGTLLDTAIWGSAGFAFSGWRARGGANFYIAQQFCGLGCRFAGVAGEVDLQVDHGVLGLLHPAPPPCHRACKAHELHVHEDILHRLQLQQRHLRGKLNRYGCARRRHQHQRLGPRCRGWYGAGDRVSAHGRVEDRIIAKLHKEGVR